MLEFVCESKIEQIEKTKTRIECQNLSYLIFYYNYYHYISLMITCVNITKFEFENGENITYI